MSLLYRAFHRPQPQKLAQARVGLQQHKNRRLLMDLLYQGCLTLPRWSQHHQHKEQLKQVLVWRQLRSPRTTLNTNRAFNNGR